MIHWLLNPENSWVTGQIFGVDGGLARYSRDNWDDTHACLLSAGLQCTRKDGSQSVFSLS
ncbi:MAG: hypothetical protein ACI9G1_003723, partial [Pirellulaceae bacterium]